VSPVGWRSPRASKAGIVVAMSDGTGLKGREREFAVLQRILDADGQRVAFVYGVAGIGKSALLNEVASGVRVSGTQVWRIDCAAIDPTEASFLAGLDSAGWQPGQAGVVYRRPAFDLVTGLLVRGKIGGSMPSSIRRMDN
jgi:hypothetical protein